MEDEFGYKFPESKYRRSSKSTLYLLEVYNFKKGAGFSME